MTTTLTQFDRKRIERLKDRPPCWQRRFAENVEAQGWVSEAQRKAMDRILEYLSLAKSTDPHDCDRDTDLSDYEAMDLGEYF